MAVLNSSGVNLFGIALTVSVLGIRSAYRLAVDNVVPVCQDVDMSLHERFPTSADIASAVASARAGMKSNVQQVAEELGLDDATARRLGFYDKEDL